jgi:hypothetical protein
VLSSVALIVTSVPDCVTTMLIVPAVLPATLLMLPAALIDCHVEPSQQ